MEFVLQNQVFFILALSLTTFGLSIYLGLILRRIKGQSSKQQSLLEEHRGEAKEREKYYQESILIIAKSAIQGDCEFAEACIRIKKLLDFFPQIAAAKEFTIIQKMFEQLDGLSYLDERKKLSKDELNRQDITRLKLENKFEDEFVKSLKILVSRFQDH